MIKLVSDDDLMELTEAELMEGWTEQNVIIVKRIMLRRDVNVLLSPTASAELPCDLGPRSEPAVRAWWHRANSPQAPLYTLDALPGHRGTGGLVQARHSVADSLRGRAHFSAVRRPALLSISALRYEDHGLYVCNVEFKYGARKSYEVELEIVVPPSQPIILDEKMNALNGTVGPYNEGTLLILNCLINGGKPEPRVTWHQGSVHLHRVYHQKEQGGRKVTLHVRTLRREHLGAVFTCEAANSNLTAPVSTSVTLAMNLKPVRAVIRGKQDFLSAEFRAEVECEAEGSLPPALVSWWLDGVRLNASLAQTRLSAGGNVTTSLLGFVPRASDNGRQLRCVATNPRMPGHDQVADSWVLQVHYKPRVSLAWGNRLNRSSIVQGTDVYFECEVDANPRLIEVSWRFEDHELASRISNFIVSNQSVALRGVQSSNTGHYSCVAANSEGASESNRVFLRVQHAPVCASKQRSVHRAAKNDEVRIQCSVRAEPANVTFQWSLNASSGPRRELAWASASGADGLASSLLLYAPENESDYGIISCWARNAMGPAPEPCLSEILPSGPPHAPQNCSVVRQVAGSLRVECTAPAPHQPGVLYQLEVRERGRRLVANLSSVSPSFWVDALPVGSQCTLLVYAIGGNERSAPLKLSATVLANAAQGYSERGKRWAISTNLLLLLLVATGLVFVLLPFIVVIALRYRRKPAEPRAAEEKPVTQEKHHWIQLSQGVELRSEPGIFPEEAFVTAMTSFKRGSFAESSSPRADGRALCPARDVC
ncbi:synaptogenesis protein syg-2-like [Dermacentor andersoni]|uniref:synaptogenesis protein syg-2-like n=1 Tax=Dermacentor andersoni TaxID=34620 RepID=UPI003B3AC522